MPDSDNQDCWLSPDRYEARPARTSSVPPRARVVAAAQCNFSVTAEFVFVQSVQLNNIYCGEVSTHNLMSLKLKFFGG